MKSLNRMLKQRRPLPSVPDMIRMGVYMQILEQVSDAVMISDEEGNYMAVNEQACQITGYSREELLSMNRRDLMDPQAFKAAQEGIREIEPGENVRGEGTLIRKDGGTLVIEASARRLEGGFLQSILRDISERKSAEAALQASEERYRSLFDATFEAIVICRDDLILEVNQTFETMFGYSRQETLGASIRNLIADEDRLPLLPDFNKEGQPEDIPELRMLCKDKSTFQAELLTRQITFRGKPAVVIAVRDLTGTHEAEKRLRENEERYRTLFEATFEAVIIHENRRIVEVNQAFEKLFGYERDEARNLTLYDLSADDFTRLSQIFSPDVENPPNMEVQGLRKDGSTFPGSVYGKIITYQGKPMGVLAIRDLTQIRRAEQQERQQRTLAEAFRYTAEIMSKARDLPEVLDAILQRVSPVVPHDAANIMLVDKEGKTLHVARARGYQRWDPKDTITTLTVPVSRLEYFRRKIDPRQPLIINDTAEFAQWDRDSPITYWIRSVITVPIRKDGNIMGVINVDSARPNSFTEEQAYNLLTFADQAAVAIENARLFESTGRALEQTQALLEANQALLSTLSLNEILNIILEQCARVLPYTTASVLDCYHSPIRVVALTAYDPVLREKTLRASQTVVERSVLIKTIVESVKSVIVDNVLDDPRWVHIAGTEHVRSWMGIPMVVQGELIGILMFSNDQVAAYSEDHLSLGSAFAAQAGLAMRNAQQFEAEQHDRLMAQLLQQTSEALSSSLMLPETLDQIVSLLHRVIPYDAAIIWEVTEEGQGVIPVVSSGISVQEDKLHETRYDLVAFPQFAEVLIQSKPLILNNTDGYSKWLGDPPGAWAGVPLIVRGKPIGFVSIANHASNSLRDVDIDVLMAFANQAAVAIDNAQLLEAQQAYITELQEAHNTLQRTSRVSAAGEIAMGIAHQINNPLTAIIAESHLLLNKVAEDSPYYEQLQAIRQAAYRAGTVVQRMLDFSRVRPYDLKPLNVNDSIRNAVALIRAQIEPHIASLSLDLESNLPLVRGSSQHLEDVWLNILLNARDAVLERPDSRINVVTQLVNSAMLEIIFRDNGVGISPENLEHLFDPFFTTKDYGTGLGLSVCYDIVTHHGGTIRAESTPGGGSAFFIRLPIETPLKEGE